MTHLSDRLNELNKNNFSTRQLAKLATDRGYPINHATVARYLNGKHPNPPRREALESLAVALGTDLANLERESGLPESRSPFELPAKAATLTDSERAAILHLIDVMVANKQAPAVSLSDVPSFGGPVDTADPDFHPERAGYDLAADHTGDEARARIDFLENLGEDSQATPDNWEGP